MIGRRTFIKSLGALGAGVACASRSRSSSAPPAPEPKKMNILILGGTGFLGPHMVAAARERGHTITLFNRGKTNPGLFTDVEQLHGDRDGNLAALEGRKWDAVLDNSGYVPRVVRASAELLAPNVDHYVFISTISVYPMKAHPQGISEATPVATLPPGEENSEEVPKHYGALKAACEKAVAEVFAGRSTAIRPGLIVGPGDPTDRFTYWPVRLDRGGDVLAPGDGKDPVQFIDGRDLAAWSIRVVEGRHTGTFNATGPERVITIGELLASCQRATSTPSNIVWVPASFLEEQNVAPWGDMPVWVPNEGESQGFTSVSNAAAIERGLVFRPVDDITRDTLAWWKSLPEERRARLKSGIRPEREKEVLAAWRAKAG